MSVNATPLGNFDRVENHGHLLSGLNQVKIDKQECLSSASVVFRKTLLVFDTRSSPTNKSSLIPGPNITLINNFRILFFHLDCVPPDAVHKMVATSESKSSGSEGSMYLANKPTNPKGSLIRLLSSSGSSVIAKYNRC